MRTRLTFAAFVAAAFVGGACTPIAEPTGSAALVDGTWSYLATNAAAPLVVSGSLSFAVRSGGSFAGSLEATESGDPSGDHRVVGVVSGRMLDSTRVDFDLTVAGGAQRHVGTIRGDSLVGTWIETSAAGVTASGAFRARRIR
jgi:hypothetical protein